MLYRISLVHQRLLALDQDSFLLRSLIVYKNSLGSLLLIQIGTWALLVGTATASTIDSCFILDLVKIRSSLIKRARPATLPHHATWDASDRILLSKSDGLSLTICFMWVVLTAT